MAATATPGRGGPEGGQAKPWPDLPARRRHGCHAGTTAVIPRPGFRLRITIAGGQSPFCIVGNLRFGNWGGAKNTVTVFDHFFPLPFFGCIGDFQ